MNMEDINAIRARELIESRPNDYSKIMERKGNWERFITGDPVREDLKEAAEGYRVISRFIEVVLKEEDTLDCTKILGMIAKRCEQEALKVEKMSRT